MMAGGVVERWVLNLEGERGGALDDCDNNDENSESNTATRDATVSRYQAFYYRQIRTSNDHGLAQKLTAEK